MIFSTRSASSFDTSCRPTWNVVFKVCRPKLEWDKVNAFFKRTRSIREAGEFPEHGLIEWVLEKMFKANSQGPKSLLSFCLMSKYKGNFCYSVKNIVHWRLISETAIGLRMLYNTMTNVAGPKDIRPSILSRRRKLCLIPTQYLVSSPCQYWEWSVSCRKAIFPNRWVMSRRCSARMFPTNREC